MLRLVQKRALPKAAPLPWLGHAIVVQPRCIFGGGFRGFVVKWLVIPSWLQRVKLATKIYSRPKLCLAVGLVVVAAGPFVCDWFDERKEKFWKGIREKRHKWARNATDTWRQGASLRRDIRRSLGLEQERSTWWPPKGWW
mmetsp:Transcript_57595/g.106453  ORF Transcript_57595/g.106453 Transcript_57595/m.106453 type:complete len:140 (-) Transcript_57595:115-534(-)